jgi:AraC-like DNA-binding protein
MKPLDTIVFETPLVRAARFRCNADDPRFRDCGPASNCAVVFPRTAVWLRYAGSRSFVADPSVATIYNPGQEYTRERITREGDRCEWFGVCPSLAAEIAASLDPHSLDHHERPFATEFAHVDRELYLAQRAFFARLERKLVDVLEAEEMIVAIVTSVIRRSLESRRTSASEDNESRIDLVHRAKATLACRLFDQVSLTDLAVELAVSPFHLCRVFRDATGMTLHDWKTDMRIRVALERLADRSTDLSRIALDCGFSSHSHFTASVRQRFGHTPSALREVLS